MGSRKCKEMDQFFSNITHDEKDFITNEINNTEVEYEKHKTVHQIFEEQVKKSPDSIAVIFDDKSMTYDELNSKSNQLALLLRAKGIGPNKIVCIMIERSFEMIIGIFAILKAGGAYLPISPEYPEKRIDYIIDDSKAVLLLTSEKFTKSYKDICVEVINIEEPSIYSGSDLNPQPINKSDNLCYVIYTSGSTGKPKGVMIEHFSVVNRLSWMQKRYPLVEGDVILQKTPFVFDVSVWELFWWSMVGARVCFLLPGYEKFPQAIIETVYKNKVTIMHFVPAMLNIFLNYIELDNKDIKKIASIRRIFASGEVLMPSHVRKFNKTLYKLNSTRLTNLYGPTETTVDVSFYDCPVNGDINLVPIGKPIHNTKFFIIKDNKLQPIGAEGELYISGDGVARGYLNNSKLTEEKFVKNPFLQDGRMYRTGDLVRMLPDGNIEFIGRIDNQVKIRGLRIELEEIESAIIDYDGIEQCAVIVKEQKENMPMLIAYIVTKDKLDSKRLKSFLKGFLPDYMIPNIFVTLESMPLKTSGKVNRNLLGEYKI